MAVEEEWLAHEAGVSALVPSRSRVFSMAADGSIRAWCSTLPCPDEQAARSASQAHLQSLLLSDVMAGAPVQTRQGDMSIASCLDWKDALVEKGIQDVRSTTLFMGTQTWL